MSRVNHLMCPSVMYAPRAPSKAPPPVWASACCGPLPHAYDCSPFLGLETALRRSCSHLSIDDQFLTAWWRGWGTAEAFG